MTGATPLVMRGRTAPTAHTPTPVNAAVFAWLALDDSVKWVLAAQGDGMLGLTMGRHPVTRGPTTALDQAHSAIRAHVRDLATGRRVALDVLGTRLDADALAEASWNVSSTPSRGREATPETRVVWNVVSELMRHDESHYQERELIVATDASMRRGCTTGAVGFVNAAGATGTASIEATSTIEAELAGIALAVHAHRRLRHVRVVVQCDNQAAVALASRVIAAANTGAVLEVPAGVEASTVRGLYYDAKKLHDRLVVQWVKGHCGDHLNEAADRLAKAARRGQHTPVLPRVREEVADHAKAA